MPAIYAHDTFGRRVSGKLDGQVKEIINRYKKFYRIGLQGPDILFFYRPYQKNMVNQTGFRMHEESMADFISYAKEVILLAGKDSPECAYVMGVICHFMLDSACHPYVYEAMKTLGQGHVEIETEFERHLMELDGVEPLSFPAARCIPAGMQVAGPVARLYPGISAAQIAEALAEMKVIKGVMVCPGKGKRAVVTGVMRLSRFYEEVYEHMFSETANPVCAESNDELTKRYRAEVAPTAALIREFFDKGIEEKKINDRFRMDFGGKDR